jgi:hypothetical protein
MRQESSTAVICERQNLMKNFHRKRAPKRAHRFKSLFVAQSNQGFNQYVGSSLLIYLPVT